MNKQILIEAIAALEWALSQPNIKINMNVWYEPAENGCTVCAAGAWLIKHFTDKMPSKVHSSYGELVSHTANPGETMNITDAINYLRMGNWLKFMGPKPHGFDELRAKTKLDSKDPHSILAWFKSVLTLFP